MLLSGLHLQSVARCDGSEGLVALTSARDVRSGWAQLYVYACSPRLGGQGPMSTHPQHVESPE